MVVLAVVLGVAELDPVPTGEVPCPRTMMLLHYTCELSRRVSSTLFWIRATSLSVFPAPTATEGASRWTSCQRRDRGPVIGAGGGAEDTWTRVRSCPHAFANGAECAFGSGRARRSTLRRQPDAPDGWICAALRDAAHAAVRCAASARSRACLGSRVGGNLVRRGADRFRAARRNARSYRTVYQAAASASALSARRIATTRAG